MQPIGPKTLTLMTQAIYNYIAALNSKADYVDNLALRDQFQDCLIKLSTLVEVAEKSSGLNEFKEAA
jgi:hypothetical protein